MPFSLAGSAGIQMQKGLGGLGFGIQGLGVKGFRVVEISVVPAAAPAHASKKFQGFCWVQGLARI